MMHFEVVGVVRVKWGRLGIMLFEGRLGCCDGWIVLFSGGLRLYLCVWQDQTYPKPMRTSCHRPYDGGSMACAFRSWQGFCCVDGCRKYTLLLQHPHASWA